MCEQRTLSKPHAQSVNHQTKIVVIYIEAIEMFVRIANQLKTVNASAECECRNTNYI